MYQLKEYANVSPLKMQCAHYISDLFLDDHQQIFFLLDKAESSNPNSTNYFFQSYIVTPPHVYSKHLQCIYTYRQSLPNFCNHQIWSAAQSTPLSRSDPFELKSNLKQDKTPTLVSLERGQRLTGTGIRHDSFPSIKMHFDGVYCNSSS